MTAGSSRATALSFQRICEEPFRVLFPIGALLGMAGVSLWLLYYSGVAIPYPGVTHARLMIEGFMASFIFGFLGTAGPRLTSAPHFSLSEVALVLTFNLLAAGAHVSEAHRLGDVCFLVCLLIFVIALAKRFRQRKDSPPPNFILVALGLLCGLAGAALIAYSSSAFYSRTYQFGSALLNECFVLLPVLGVAPFFIRRLLDLPTSEMPESRVVPPGWWRKAAFAAVIGLTVVLSFLIDSFAEPRVGGLIRIIAVLLYIIRTLPFHGHSFLANSLRGAIVAIVLGFGVIPLIPIYRIAALHIVFITGFSLMAFTVGTRVIFGHSCNLSLLHKRLWFFTATIALLFVAMLSRFTADLLPRLRTVHLLAGAFFWLAGAIVWMVRVIPKVAIAEECSSSTSAAGFEDPGMKASR